MISLIPIFRSIYDEKFLNPDIARERVRVRKREIANCIFSILNTEWNGICERFETAWWISFHESKLHIKLGANIACPG